MVTLRIEGKGGTASGYRVFLDDEEVSDFTRAVSLDMSVDDANVATLEVYVDRVEISAEVEGKLDLIPTGEPERATFASRFREWVGR